MTRKQQSRARAPRLAEGEAGGIFVAEGAMGKCKAVVGGGILGDRGGGRSELRRRLDLAIVLREHVNQLEAGIEAVEVGVVGEGSGQPTRQID